jgi:hypothetical protein
MLLPIISGAKYYAAGEFHMLVKFLINYLEVTEPSRGQTPYLKKQAGTGLRVGANGIYSHFY